MKKQLKFDGIFKIIKISESSSFGTPSDSPSNPQLNNFIDIPTSEKIDQLYQHILVRIKISLIDLQNLKQLMLVI